MAAQPSVLFSYYLTIKLSRTVVNFDIDKLSQNQSILTWENNQSESNIIPGR